LGIGDKLGGVGSYLWMVFQVWESLANKSKRVGPLQKKRSAGVPWGKGQGMENRTPKVPEKTVESTEEEGEQERRGEVGNVGWKR